MDDALRLPIASEPDAHLVVRISVPRGTPRAGVLLYLHGFGSHQGGVKAEAFRALALADGLPFCSFDFRGHGASDGDTLGLTLSRNLEDVACVRAELARRELAPVYLCGSSMGGLTALWHAARQPQGLSAGLTLAPALGFARGLAELLGEPNIRRWREDGRLRFLNEEGASDVGWGLVPDLEAHDEETLATELSVPFLAFQGQRDETVDWRRVAAFAESCPALFELDLLPEGDHRLLEHLAEIWERWGSWCGLREGQSANAGR